MLAARPRPTASPEIQALSARKEAIEAEIEAQSTILKANNVWFEEKLVDAEGFPRADIDVWAVRTARVRIIELRNDYKAVLDDLSKALQVVWARGDTGGARSSDGAQAPRGEEADAEEEIPFARVDGVQPGSPAATAVSLSEFQKPFPHFTVIVDIRLIRPAF